MVKDHQQVVVYTVQPYLIINGNGSPIGCGLHGYSLVSFPFGSIFLFLFQVVALGCLFVCFVVPVYYTKLSGRGLHQV